VLDRSEGGAGPVSVHDACLVRPSQVQVGAADDRGAVELGNSLCGILGGNQMDAVTIERADKRRVLGYRWPTGA
jgi:hypothetical protein